MLEKVGGKRKRSESPDDQNGGLMKERDEDDSNPSASGLVKKRSSISLSQRPKSPTPRARVKAVTITRFLRPYQTKELSAALKKA